MRTPPLLLGAALVFWGWQSGYFVAAAVMAAVLEGARLIPARWEFTDKDFDRLWNFCTVLFLAAALYAFTSNQGPSALRDLFQSPSSLAGQKSAIDQTLRATLVFTQWLPFVFFVFMAAQAYSRRDTVDLSTFSLLLRWRRSLARNAAPSARRLNVSYPYFAVVLAAASIGGPLNHWFYAGLCVLVGWALWPERSRRFAWPLWLASAVAAATLGFAGQRGLYRLYELVQNYSPEWLSNLGQRGFDAKESRTSLGHLGQLKQSGRIVWRLTPKDGQAPPLLLREASYRAFRSPTWLGAGAEKDFGEVTPGTREGEWALLRDKRTTSAVTIAGCLPGGRGLLSLPSGTARLENLPVLLLRTNRLGAVRVEAGPGLVIFDPHYGSGQTFDAPPGDEDWEVAEKERAAIFQIANTLGLEGKSVAQIQQAIAAFFATKFRYTTWQAGAATAPPNQTPLTRFLLETRAGHCEYFATATVLLLRAAGVPARYAAGYAVDERSGDGFVVRQRHAHAWCLAYVDGGWQDFDTTPGTWFEIEARNASLFESLSDAGSWLWFEFTKLRYGQSGLRRYVWWIVVPVLALSLGQLLFRKSWRRARSCEPATEEARLRQGLDSEFYLIERYLARTELARRTDETVAAWLGRIAAVPALVSLREPLAAVGELHARHRFDPVGLSPAERQRLRTAARACVARMARDPRQGRTGPG